MYNTHNICLLHILNTVYICPIPDQIVIPSLFSNSESNEIDCCSVSLGCRIMVYVQSNYKWCRSGGGNLSLKLPPLLSQSWIL